MYKTEAEFSRALCDKLSRVGLFHQRIESGLTGRGVPDLYVVGARRELWIELKNVTALRESDDLIIPWRAGQQAWMLRYHAATSRAVVTIVATRDCFLWIDVVKRYAKNIVPVDDIIVKYTLDDVISEVINVVF
jgi:hypothetical protein